MASQMQQKKKFGKNLNKLVKPAAPPIVNSNTGQSQSRNGLLLLSSSVAQKKSGTGLLSKQQTAVQYSLQEEEVQVQPPDAWGTATSGTSADSPTTTKEQTTVVREAEEPDSQVLYMSRLAKEKAAVAARQEEERLQQQKERAAARLRELDERRRAEGLGTTPPQQRGLWEPAGQQRQQQQPEPRPRAPEPRREQQQPPQPAVEPQQQEPNRPVIHLTSYEDRDRGERGTAAPRMLYDPKSGSMVAVKARSELQPKKPARPRPNKPRKQVVERKQRPSRLPRTCGVLYERDEKGHLRCVDGCEGDLGYGAHSVVGGRVNNAEAYAEFVQQQEEEQDAHYNETDDVNMQQHQEITLQTGFHLEPREPEPLEWIKADDKLELVTGMDDSPMLKPTAKAFAPSQAAIAAAAAAAAKQPDSSTEEEEEESDGGSFGLGFDPAHDMHGLMQSPPTLEQEPPDHLVASVDLDALQLGGASNFGNDHIFAFGSSGTWGNNNKTKEQKDDWGALPPNLFGEPASFLGWGALGGLSSSLNQDNKAGD